MSILDDIKSLFFKKEITTPETKANPYYTQAFGDFGGLASTFKTKEGQIKAYQTFAYVAIALDNIMRDAGNRKLWFEDFEGNELDIDRVDEKIKTPFVNGYADLSVPQLLSNIAGHKKLTGNAYFYVAEESMYGLLRKVPEVFIPLNPAKVKPRLTDSGLFLRHYEVEFNNGKKQNIEPEKIIHFRQNALENPWVGIGDVEKAVSMYENEFEKAKYEKNFFKKGASPSMIVTEESERLPEDLERVIDMIQRKYSGSDNAGKMMWLNGKGINATTMGIAQKDMQFLEQNKWVAETILKLFGVPPTVAGSETANRATAEIQRLSYLGSTINPIIKDMEDAINKQFVNKIDPRVFVRFEKHNTGDVENIIKKLQAGIITPNMASEALNEVTSDDPSRDDYYMQSVYLPVSTLFETTPNTQQETNEEEKSLDVSCETRGYKGAMLDPHNWEIIVKTFEDYVASDGRKWQVRYLREGLKARVKTEDQYTPKMERFYKSQKNRVLKAIMDNAEKIFRIMSQKSDYPIMSKGIEDNILEIIFNINEENEIIRKDVRPLHTSAIQKAISNNNDITGSVVNPNLSNPFVANEIDRLGKNIVGSVNTNGDFISVNETIRKQISKIITKTVATGEGIEEMTSQIDKALGGQARMKARRIARTESRVAYDAGSKMAYKELGVEYIDVVGCEQLEPDSDCGARKVPIDKPLVFHPNHIGVVVPHDEP